MAGYSQMNGGYNEQPGLPWGTIAAYSAGGIAAAGVVKMGATKMGAAWRQFRSNKETASEVTGKSSTRKAMKKAARIGRKAFGSKRIGMAGDAYSDAVRSKFTEARMKARAHNKSLPFGPLEEGQSRKWMPPSLRSLETAHPNTMKAARGVVRGAGFLGAADFAGKGAKRFGYGALRTGTAAIGAGLAINALDFLNPFGFGSIDD